MVEAFKGVWKKDFNFRILVVFWILFCFDAVLNETYNPWITIPYLTSLFYSWVKVFLEHRAHRKFMKVQKELQGRFEAAIEKRDKEEVEKLIALLEKHLIEYGEKMGFEPCKKEEL